MENCLKDNDHETLRRGPRIPQESLNHTLAQVSISSPRRRKTRQTVRPPGPSASQEQIQNPEVLHTLPKRFHRGLTLHCQFPHTFCLYTSFPAPPKPPRKGRSHPTPSLGSPLVSQSVTNGEINGQWQELQSHREKARQNASGFGDGKGSCRTERRTYSAPSMVPAGKEEVSACALPT